MATYLEALMLFQRYCRPRGVADLTTNKITTFVAELRKGGKRSDATIAKHLRSLRAVANWAYKQELIAKKPAFDMPNPGEMKGRPITGEEFERMLVAAEQVVGPEAAESWRLLLRGLWWSGLRRGEAVALRWDHCPGGVSVSLRGRESTLSFDAGSQKSGKAQPAPLAPEAAELFAPLHRPTGYVFNPECQWPSGRPMARDRVKWTKVISAIGAEAGVVTDSEKGTTATAHDLRRSFGDRWAQRLTRPVELKELMRHSKIETTLRYYVRRDAAAASASLWKVYEEGNSSGNTEAFEATSESC